MSEAPQQFNRNPDHDQPHPFTPKERQKFAIKKSIAEQDHRTAAEAKARQDAQNAEMIALTREDEMHARAKEANEDLAPLDSDTN
jgi:hypothetical protein